MLDILNTLILTGVGAIPLIEGMMRMVSVANQSVTVAEHIYDGFLVVYTSL